MDKDGSCLGLVVLAVLGVAFVAIGVFAGMSQVARTLREARLIESLPELDVPPMRNLAPDTLVAVTGILEPNEDQADAEGLIIYLEQVWAIEDSEDEGWEGSWEVVYRAMPTNTLTLTGGSVTLRYTSEIEIDGTLHGSRLYIPEQGRKVEDIIEGTLRHVGFKAGDQLMVVGLRITGAIFGLVGVILMAVAGVLLWRQRKAH